MTKKLLFLTTILLALSIGAMAADLTGKWVAEQPGRNGGAPRQTTFNLKADGSKLTTRGEARVEASAPARFGISLGMESCGLGAGAVA